MNHLVVRIERHDRGSQREGILKACVFQGGKLGRDMLRERSLTNVESAKKAVLAELFFVIKPGVSVEFEVIEATTQQRAEAALQRGDAHL